MKLSEVGEERIVSRIVSSFVDSFKNGVLKPGEDSRDFKLPGIRGLISIDGYSIESVKLPWRDLSDIGWCLVTSVVSDIVCKGGYPFALTIALGIPKNWEIELVNELLGGIKEASKEYKVKLLGGDTNESKDPWVVASAIGYAEVDKLPSRSGAKPKDYIIVTNYYGAMGVISIDGISVASNYKWVKEYTRRPKASIEIAKIINDHPNVIHASMDVSDGLGYTLYSIANYSKVSMEVIDKPLYPRELLDYCENRKRNIWDYILFGGEEYGVVLTVEPNAIELIIKELRECKVPYRVIGRVLNFSDKPIVNISGYGTLKSMRWDQFKGWIKNSI